MTSHETAITRVLHRLTAGRLGSLIATMLVGVISGLWVGYVLIYPYSSLPIPRYTLGVVVFLGIYIDYFAGSMLDRIIMLFSAIVIAYIVGVFVFVLPAVIGVYPDPVVQRALYLTALNRAVIFTLPVMVLLLAGTFAAYLFRNTYEEIAR